MPWLQLKTGHDAKTAVTRWVRSETVCSVWDEASLQEGLRYTFVQFTNGTTVSSPDSVDDVMQQIKNAEAKIV